MRDSEGQLKKGIILNYINLALGSVIPIFYTPVMLSLLGQSEYGLYKLSGSVTGYLGLISLGLGSAITRYLIKAKTEEGEVAEQKILGLFVLVFRVLAIIALLLGTILAFNLDIWYSESLSNDELHKMRCLVMICVCNLVVNFLNTSYLSLVNSHEHFLFIQSMNIGSTLFIPLANLVALYLGFASIGLVTSSLIMTLVYRLLYYLYVSYKMKISPIYTKPSKELIVDILTFSFWVLISNIVSFLYGTTDMLMIGYLPELATVGVAIYSIGETFTSVISTMNAGISSLLIPRANKMVFSNATNSELTDMAIKMGRIQCYILFLIVFGFISFGKPFIHFYIGDEYAESYWVTVFCIVPTIIPLVQSFCLNILIAKNKNKFRALLYLCIAILNVFGTWLMINIWGVSGAAFMTGISMLLGHGIIMNWYYYRIIGLNIVKFWQKIGQLVLFPLMLTAVTVSLYSIVDFYCLKNLIIGICLFSIIYALINWKYVMNENEKLIVKSIIKVK